MVGGYAGVCQKPYQFSCWNKNDPNFAYLSGAKQIPFRELAQAWIAADHVIDGKVQDPTGGATHYYATAMKKTPAWATRAGSPKGGPFFVVWRLAIPAAHLQTV